MKNLLIFLFLFLAFLNGGRTQSLLLEYNQQVLDNQSLLVRSGTPDSLDMTTWLKITNISSDTAMVMAKKEIITQVPGASASICWAGYCYPPDVNVSAVPLKLDPGESARSCFAHFGQQGNVGTSTVRWTYFLRDNPDDSVCVTIRYQIWPAGIKNISPDAALFSLPYPNPADRMISFSRYEKSDNDITLSVYDNYGKIVLRNIFTSGNPVLSVSTEGLPSGIYYYSLNIGYQNLTTGNFIIFQ